MRKILIIIFSILITSCGPTKEDTTPADVDVEEGFRMIVSSGIVGSHKNSIVK